MKGRMSSLVKQLVNMGVLKSVEYINSFLSVDRADFMWPGYEDYAYLDQPAPLGDTGQTISAPHIHAYYLEYTKPNENSIVLEIGAGSGYLSALIGRLIKDKSGSGHVYSIEFNPTLFNFASRNIRKTGLEDYVTVIPGNGIYGWPPKSNMEHYDVILVSAGIEYVPTCLLNQLKIDGRIIIPIGKDFYQQLTLIERRGEKDFVKKRLFTVAFVRMAGVGNVSC